MDKYKESPSEAYAAYPGEITIACLAGILKKTVHIFEWRHDDDTGDFTVGDSMKKQLGEDLKPTYQIAPQGVVADGSIELIAQLYRSPENGEWTTGHFDLVMEDDEDEARPAGEVEADDTADCRLTPKGKKLRSKSPEDADESSLKDLRITDMEQTASVVQKMKRAQNDVVEHDDKKMRKYHPSDTTFTTYSYAQYRQILKRGEA